MRIPRFLEEIFPFGSYLVYSRHQRLRSELIEILNEKEYTNYGSLSKDKIEERLKEEYQRASAMDEKTSKLTFSFSIASTFVGAMIIFLKSTMFPITMYMKFSMLINFLICAGLFYCVIAGLIALGALRTAPRYGFGTALLLKHDEALNEILAESLARQEIINLVRHQRNEAAFQSLRNGLLFFIVVIVMFVGTSLYRFLSTF